MLKFHVEIVDKTQLEFMAVDSNKLGTPCKFLIEGQLPLRVQGLSVYFSWIP
jgi:hypothetical protein